MIGLGLISRIKKWISPEQAQGLNAIVFKILFPVLVFNILFTSSFQAQNFAMMAYVFLAFLAAMGIAKLFSRVAGPFANLAPYLCVTDEGGSVGLPLYLSLVGVQYAVNTVTFDVAGCLICFGLCPILASGALKDSKSLKSVLKNMFSNEFLICVILGLILNFCGVYRLIESSAFADVYNGIISMITTPVTALILFYIGYTLKLSHGFLKSLSALMGLRMVLMVLIVAGFFLFFPERMSDPIFLAGVLIYFSCPVAFPMPGMIEPAFNNKDDMSFCSAFISMNMIITLVVFTLVALFVPLP